MKSYQVTRKRQITIPRKLAEKRGINPGDSVIFEEVGDSIMFKKSPKRRQKNVDSENIRRAIRSYSEDIPKIKKQVKLAESGLVENLSRHVGSK